MRGGGAREVQGGLQGWISTKRRCHPCSLPGRLPHGGDASVVTCAGATPWSRGSVRDRPGAPSDLGTRQPLGLGPTCGFSSSCPRGRERRKPSGPSMSRPAHGRKGQGGGAALASPDPRPLAAPVAWALPQPVLREGPSPWRRHFFVPPLPSLRGRFCALGSRAQASKKRPSRGQRHSLRLPEISGKGNAISENQALGPRR